MPSKVDNQILHYLESGTPEDFDDFIDLVGKALTDAMPSIKKMVSAFGNNFDPDEVVSRGVELALERLHKQYNGKETSFPFERRHELTFLAWVMHNIGRPGAGAKSGVIGDEIKKNKRTQERLQSMDSSAEELIGVADPGFDRIEKEECSRALNAAVGALTPREQFIIRTEFGLHDHNELRAVSIMLLAEQSKLPRCEIAKIRRRAKSTFESKSVSRDRLTQSEIGALLDIGAKQVRNIKNSGLEKLRLRQEIQ